MEKSWKFVSDKGYEPCIYKWPTHVVSYAYMQRVTATACISSLLYHYISQLCFSHNIAKESTPMSLLNIMKKKMTELLTCKTTDFLKAHFTQTPMMKDGK